MKRVDCPLNGVCVLEPTVFGDERGWFLESWNAATFAKLGIQATFVQDNHSKSRRGILRGLHYQLGKPQGKLVRCIAGSIFDVAVDIRRASPTFGKWIGVELSAENRRQMWVPCGGFAHGFLVLSETAEVIYKVTDYWSKEHERGLHWQDPALAIHWPDIGVPPTVNARDAAFPVLSGVPADMLG